MSDLAISAALAAGGARVQYLVWVRVRSQEGAPVAVGWTDSPFPFSGVVDGEARVYAAAHGGFSVGAVRYVIGLNVGTLDLSFAAAPEFDSLVRFYRLAGGLVDIHRAVWDASETLVGVVPVFRGLMDGAPVEDSAGEARRVLSLVSASGRAGTLTQGGFKSDASQRLRDPGDTFFLYGSNNRAVSSDPWGGR